MKDRVNPKQVTLAIHPGQESETVQTETEKRLELEADQAMAKAAGVDVSEIQHLEAQIRKILKSTKNLLTEVKMGAIRKDAHNKAVDYSSSQSLYMTFFEAAAFMGICAFNLYHIKGILENRRII